MEVGVNSCFVALIATGVGVNSYSVALLPPEVGVNRHGQNKIVVLAICLVTTIVCECPSYANSKNVVLVKHFVGG